MTTDDFNPDSISELTFTDISLGPVYLVSRNLERTINAYSDFLGFEILKQDDDYISFGLDGKEILNFKIDPDARAKAPTDAGLYHIAILLPERRDLAKFVQMLIDSNIRFASADHLVSEAIYLYDSDGLGIEVYWDKPSSEWVWENDKVKMDTLPIDIDVLLDEIEDINDVWDGVPAGTKIGHIHLQVPDLKTAEDFYTKTLGLNLTSTFPGALFLAADGYHHHIGLNNWHTKGIAQSDDNVAGLRAFDITIPDPTIFESFKRRVSKLQPNIGINDNEIELRDILNNRILVKTLSE
ncbi:MAG TPA: VOC family protein [Ignavibacteria bacterium]|nr:VOC family protein [Ignavibacteria bacterium]